MQIELGMDVLIFGERDSMPMRILELFEDVVVSKTSASEAQ